MGKHSVPEGGKSTSEKTQGSYSRPEHTPKHSRPDNDKPAGSDVPPRGEGLK